MNNECNIHHSLFIVLNSPFTFLLMAIISSHVLDSVIGDHAKNIRIACFRLASTQREAVFDVIANEQGRIAEQITAQAGEQYELVFHTAAYFAAQPNMPDGRQIIHEVVVRFDIPNPDERIHIPLMLSPHSYSVWWSA